MKISKIALAVCATLIFGTSSVYAVHGTKGNKDSDCSPGYWKNHTDVWAGFENFDQLLADLQARGPGSRAIREAAQAILNEHFEEGSACEEDD